MASIETYREIKHRAFKNVICTINEKTCFPFQVFLGGWSSFWFFESDRLFAPEFAIIAADILKVEGAAVCCLLNFNETDQLAYESGAMRFIQAGTKPYAYDDMLRHGGPTNGWLFGMDRYGCASDRGGWSIYCEKGNDVAAIALRQPDDVGKYGDCLKQLHAEQIATLLKADAATPAPFDQLTESWHRGLTQHYTDYG